LTVIDVSSGVPQNCLRHCHSVHGEGNHSTGVALAMYCRLGSVFSLMSTLTVHLVECGSLHVV